MGAGKTTVGRLLAAKLGWAFEDSDQEIERRTGVRIPIVFEIEGEAGFRRRESTILAERLQAADGLILATGGGAVMRPENRELMKTVAGLVAYIDVSPQLLYQRTKNDKNRPLLQVDNPLAKLEELYAIRDPLYREAASIVISGDRHSAKQIAHYLEKEVRKKWLA